MRTFTPASFAPGTSSSLAGPGRVRSLVDPPPSRWPVDQRTPTRRPSARRPGRCPGRSARVAASRTSGSASRSRARRMAATAAGLRQRQTAEELDGAVAHLGARVVGDRPHEARHDVGDAQLVGAAPLARQPVDGGEADRRDGVVERGPERGDRRVARRVVERGEAVPPHPRVGVADGGRAAARRRVPRPTRRRAGRANQSATRRASSGVTRRRYRRAPIRPRRVPGAMGSIATAKRSERHGFSRRRRRRGRCE